MKTISKYILLNVILLIIAFLLLSSCSKSKAQNSAINKSAQRRVQNLTKEKLSKATYFQFTGNNRSLTSGPYDQEENGSTLYLLRDPIAFGDLRGDGGDYAVVF